MEGIYRHMVVSKQNPFGYESLYIAARETS